jgi:xylulokinase
MVVDYVIGIDIGTTNIKGSVYSSIGKLVSSSNTDYESYSPKINYHEQNPDDWIDGFFKIFKELLINDEIKKGLKAISLSTQGGTIIPVDKDFHPLTRAITWLDRRSAETLKKNKELSERNVEFYNKTGWRLDTNISFAPLCWLRENKRKIFDKIYKVLYVNDYVLKKIADINYQDPSNASMTLFYNIKNRKWDQDILNLLDFDEKKFSEIKDSGEVIGYLNNDLCKKLGIKNKIKVINGGHDQYCAGIGAGIFSENKILLATGTAWVIFKMLNNTIFDNKHFFSIGRNIVENKFGLIYSIPSAGVSLRWFASNMMNFKSEQQLFKLENKHIEKIKKIKNNIIFYPYLTGAYGPDFNFNRKASLLNLEIGHNYLDVMVAIMEGAGFQFKKILNVLSKKGIKVEAIKMVGGGARSRIWPKIIANITALNILIPEDLNIDFATKGAAILAGYGAGIFKSLEDGYNILKSNFRMIEPDKENIDFYKNKFKLFLKYNHKP